LKYYTKTLELLLHGKSFGLRDHAADDLLRYSFCKDAERIEIVSQIIRQKPDINLWIFAEGFGGGRGSGPMRINHTRIP